LLLCSVSILRPPSPPLFPYTTLFRSASIAQGLAWSWSPTAGASQEDLPALTLDPVVDRLQAARSLGGQAWGRQWAQRDRRGFEPDRKSTRLNSSHVKISYAVFCLKKK